MRAALYALLAFGTFSAIGATPAAAAQRDLPFCMRSVYGDDDCSYYTYQQCAVTSSGLGTTCFANPALAYGYNEEQPAPRRRHRHRHHHAQ
jgi:Protein of unknown function (DUF3551)